MPGLVTSGQSWRHARTHKDQAVDWGTLSKAGLLGHFSDMRPLRSSGYEEAASHMRLL